ncbi:ATP-dependent RNA helicase [archaeon]|nr:MAG: ATP-dependent RNA helicase [archaeon]
MHCLFESYYCLYKFNVETGSGKSTQLPLYLHEGGWTKHGYSVVCTQPRRIAAITVASRVAEEFGCKLGEEVGYGIRFDFNCSDKTLIKYYTDGVLLRETMTDPLLQKYGVIIIDEAHQRTLHSDILMGLLKKIKKKRSDLRIIVTSATMDASAFKNFFELNDTNDRSQDTAVIMSVQGRQHLVDVLYVLESCRNYLSAAVDTVLSIHQYEDVGDILVFLPGGEEIDTAIAMLNERYEGNNMFFLPLYASLPHHMQMQVFQPTPPNMRKVVLATNIAEASITIEGIRYVVDSGYVKLNYIDVRSGLDALLCVPVTKSQAIQRAGRAGRTQPGKCFRLMTENTFISLDTNPPAEMQRVDISWAVLQLKALGIHDVLHFDFLSPPSSDSMIFALELLYSLGAIDDCCSITDLGAKMAEMPLEPRVAKCLLSSFDHGCCEEMLTIAAMVTVEYPFISQRRQASQESKVKLQKDMEHFAILGSDHLTLLRIYQEFTESNYAASWCDSMSLQFRILSRAKEIRYNLTNMLKRFKNEGDVLSSCGQDDKAVRRCLVSGFFSQAARLLADGKYHTLRGDVKVDAHPQSVVEQFGAPAEWVIYHEVIHSKATYIREISKIDPMWLHELAQHYYNLQM